MKYTRYALVKASGKTGIRNILRTILLQRADIVRYVFFSFSNVNLQKGMAGFVIILRKFMIAPLEEKFELFQLIHLKCQKVLQI